MPISSVSGNGFGKVTVVLSWPALLTFTFVTLLHTTIRYFPGWYSSAGGLNTAPDMAVPLHIEVTAARASGHPEVNSYIHESQKAFFFVQLKHHFFGKFESLFHEDS